ncbi:MAG TPA: tetratricopeptide repeat protein [Patescibacteria group bacterium]|nr:tetratricopeptide repeat protein [Patescibacteria group bacterium]
MLLTEAGLRLCGYGYSTDFFRPGRLNGREVLMENPDFARRFFPAGLVRTAQPFVVPAVKPRGTIRIFVFGESAAMGDPDFKFGLPPMLEVLLREHCPANHFEVVNAAVVAIDSHIVLPIARDCARQHGDLWVIYMGNNEAVGPFGSASVFGTRAPPLWIVRGELWLRSLRLSQLMEKGLQAVRHRAPREWGGMEMMAQQRVPSNSAANRRVRRHFEKNLNDLLEIGTRAGVPIVLCTVPTNLRECPPFASVHRPDLTEAQLSDWRAAFAKGVAAQSARNYEQARTAYECAREIDNQFAELTFRVAQCHEFLFGPADASKYYIQARDQDALQFRTDGPINALIRQTAGAFTARGVHLLDAETLFSNQSGTSLPGAQYFYEHVHLTPEGNYLLARAVAEQASAALNLADTRPWLSQSECFDQLGFTDWNRYDALNTILERIDRAPFTQQCDHQQQKQRIIDEMARYRLATKPAQVRQQAAKVTQLAALHPDNPNLQWNAAALLQDAGDLSGAQRHWEALMQLQPQSALPVYNMGRLLESAGRMEEARHMFREALRINPEYKPAKEELRRMSAPGTAKGTHAQSSQKAE